MAEKKEFISTRLGGFKANEKDITKRETLADGTVRTHRDNGMIQTDFRNREVQEPTQPLPVTQTPEVAQTEVVPEPQGIQEAPVVPEIQPAPESVTPTTPTEPIQPITATAPTKVEAPIQTAQEIKNEAIANETNEIALTNQKKETATAEFTNLVNSGASIEEIAKFTNANPDFRDSYNSVLRSHFKNSANTKFFSAYNGMSNENMYSAVKNGEITMFSDRYNMLSEGQRQAFEQFKAIKEAPDSVVTEKEQVFNSELPENKVDFNNIETFISKMFSSDLRTQLEKARNDDRVVDLSTKLNAKASEIEKYDLESIKSSKQLRTELGNAGYTPAYINAAITDNEANRAIVRMGKVSEYNMIQGNLSSIKDDIETDLKLFEYEDKQNKEKYEKLLDIYESRRGEQLASESKEADREFTREQTQEQREYEAKKLEFLEQNKILAENRANDFKKELLNIEQEFKNENKEPTYKIAQNGKIYAIADGKAVEVKNQDGEVIFQEVAPKFTETIYKNTDGTFSSVRTYQDGSSPAIETYTADGNIVGVNTNTTDFLHKWEGFRNNAYLDIAGIPTIGYGFTSINGKPVQMGDSISQAEADIEFQKQIKNYQNFRNFIDVDLSPAQETALTSFEYNLGRGIWTKPIGNAMGVINAINSGDIEAAQREMVKFNKARDPNTGKLRVAKGLQNRRDEEAQMLGFSESVKAQDPIVDSMLSGLSSLKDLTPTEKAEFIPKLQEELEQRYTEDDERNSILRSALSTKAIGDTTLTKLQDMELVKFQLDNIEANLLNQDTGPILGKIAKLNPYDVDAQVALAQLAGLTPKVARGIFGEVGVLTDTDIANYQKALPNLTSVPEKNALVVEFMRDLLAEGVKQTVVGQAKGKRNVIEYLEVYDDVIKLQQGNVLKNTITPPQPTGPGSLFNNVNQGLQISGYDEFTP